MTAKPARQRKGFWEWAIPVLMTLVFAVACIGLYAEASDLAAATASTTGTVLDVHNPHSSKRCEMDVGYTVKGKEYGAEVDCNTTNMHIGQTLTVTYDPDDPKRIGNNTSAGQVLLLAVIAIGFATAFVLYLLRRRRERRTATAGQQS